MRFRLFTYAVVAEIEGMFIQVGVVPRDGPSLRFLWREDPTFEIDFFQYAQHIIVSKDSPKFVYMHIRVETH